MGYIESYFKEARGAQKAGLIFFGLLLMGLALFAPDFFEGADLEGIPANILLFLVGLTMFIIGILVIIFTGSKGISLNFSGGRR